MRAVKLIQVNINSGILSSTLAQETRGRNMRALCQTGGRWRSRHGAEGRKRENDKISLEVRGTSNISFVLLLLRDGLKALECSAGLRTMTIPPDCSAVHMLMMGAMPMVVPWK